MLCGPFPGKGLDPGLHDGLGLVPNYALATAEPDLRSGLWRLNIAAAHQGQGHGRYAVAAVAAELRRRGTPRLTTTWHVGDGSPELFYLGLGFSPTGEMSGGERVGELEL